MSAAPVSLRSDLERLQALLMQPDEIQDRRSDPLVVESVRAVLNASPPDECGWVR